MALYCLVTFPQNSGKPQSIYELKQLPDLLKVYQEGLARSPFWFSESDLDAVRAGILSHTLPLGGPFTVTHAIRHAADLLLDECGHEDMTVQLEIAGKRLPELPPRQELEALLRDERTLVLVNSKPHKPSGEVLGFQTVYDDTVRFIEELKKLGIPQDAIFITATPDEITLEIHPAVFGDPLDTALPQRYRQLLIDLGGVRISSGRLLRTFDKTLTLSTTDFDIPVLLPGSIHPSLHRPKVAVGPSHFAYGTAAFSDFCGKKRTLEECLRELKSWLKFLETTQPSVQAAIQALNKAAPPISQSAAALQTPDFTPNSFERANAPKPASPTAQSAIEAAGLNFDAQTSYARRPDEFRPFKTEVAEYARSFPENRAQSIRTPWNELNKNLGGGWKENRLHLIVGGREEGKASFLLQQALHMSEKYSVLYISAEHTSEELRERIASRLGRLSAIELKMQAAAEEFIGAASQKLKALYGTVANTIRESLYIRGADSAVSAFDAEALAELVKMMPQSSGRVLIIESLYSEIPNKMEQFLSDLRKLAADRCFTVLASLHTPFVALQRPHFIDAPDLEILNDWQAATENIIHISSERMNLRKFLAMAHGKVEQPAIDALEKKMYEGGAGTKQRNDTYSLLRLLHTRAGKRSVVLFLYQRDLLRWWEGPSIPLGRP